MSVGVYIMAMYSASNPAVERKLESLKNAASTGKAYKQMATDFQYVAAQLEGTTGGRQSSEYKQLMNYGTRVFSQRKAESGYTTQEQSLEGRVSHVGVPERNFEVVRAPIHPSYDSGEVREAETAAQKPASQKRMPAWKRAAAAAIVAGYIGLQALSWFNPSPAYAQNQSPQDTASKPVAAEHMEQSGNTMPEGFVGPLAAGENYAAQTQSSDTKGPLLERVNKNGYTLNWDHKYVDWNHDEWYGILKADWNSHSRTLTLKLADALVNSDQWFAYFSGSEIVTIKPTKTNMILDLSDADMSRGFGIGKWYDNSQVVSGSLDNVVEKEFKFDSSIRNPGKLPTQYQAPAPSHPSGKHIPSRPGPTGTPNIVETPSHPNEFIPVVPPTQPQVPKSVVPNDTGMEIPALPQETPGMAYRWLPFVDDNGHLAGGVVAYDADSAIYTQIHTKSNANFVPGQKPLSPVKTTEKGLFRVSIGSEENSSFDGDFSGIKDGEWPKGKVPDGIDFRTYKPDFYGRSKELGLDLTAPNNVRENIPNASVVMNAPSGVETPEQLRKWVEEQGGSGYAYYEVNGGIVALDKPIVQAPKSEVLHKEGTPDLEYKVKFGSNPNDAANALWRIGLGYGAAQFFPGDGGAGEGVLDIEGGTQVGPAAGIGDAITITTPGAEEALEEFIYGGVR